MSEQPCMCDSCRRCLHDQGQDCGHPECSTCAPQRTREFCLDCPECGADVFARSENVYGEDEEERCPECGIRLLVGIEGEDEDARAYAWWPDET